MQRRATFVLVGVLAISPFILTAAALGWPRPVWAVPPTCKAWVARTLKAAHKVGEQKWRGVIVSALPDSCEAIPGVLREAARATNKAAEGERAQNLTRAAQVALGPGCAVSDPATDARKVASTCPLARRDFKIDDRALGDMRAADYVLLAALLKALVAANQYDASAEELLRSFTLSACLLGEETTKRETDKKAEPDKKPK